MNFSHRLPAVIIGGAIATLIQPQIAAALSPAEVNAIAKQITVRIDGANTGTGVIVDRQGNNYTVVTNWHVVGQSGTYTIQTPDGKSHSVSSFKLLPGVDLAVIEFSSSQTYRVAELADADKLTEGTTVYVAGWADPDKLNSERGYIFTNGSISRLLKNPKQGYGLVYNNVVKPGMSGGPVLDDRGRLVGINGQAVPDARTQATDFAGIPINYYKKPSSTQVATRTASSRPSLPPVAATSNNSQAEEFFQQGADKFKRSDWQGAIAAFDRAITLNPNYADAYYKRGNAFLGANKLQQAIENLEKAAELFEQQGKQGDAYKSRGLALIGSKDYRGAIEAYDRAIHLNPNDVESYVDRGSARTNLKQYDRALEDYNQAIRLDPNNAYAYEGRGGVRYNLKQYDLALEDYNQAIGLNPNNAYAHLNRGNLRYDLKQYDRALEDYNRAIRLDPNNAYAYEGRGRVRYALKQYDRALEDNSQAIRLNPSYANAYYSRGLIFKQQKDNQKALADFQKAARLYQQQGNQEWYQNALNQIRELE
jgi:tetratricopeptide (TPR) repeat protein